MSETPDVVRHLLAYAGRTMGDETRPRNPNITAREAIVIADYLAELESKAGRLRAERDTAVIMLAEWCVAVDVNGAGWDDWDEHYKDAAYRPGPLREQIDTAMAAHKKLMGYD